MEQLPQIMPNPQGKLMSSATKDISPKNAGHVPDFPSTTAVRTGSAELITRHDQPTHVSINVLLIEYYTIKSFECFLWH